VGDVISGVGLRPFWFRLPGPGPNLLWNFCLKFLLETRLEFRTYEPSVDFLTFRAAESMEIGKELPGKSYIFAGN